MSVATSFLWIPLAVLVFLLPGLVWRAWFVQHGQTTADRDVGELAHLADAAGIGLSLVALAGMAGFFLRLRMPGWLVWAAAGLLLAGLGWLAVRGRREAPADGGSVFGDRARELLPAAVFAAIVLFRFYQARSLVLPAWVDSIHHTLLVRVILERGGLPQTLDPYLPVPLYYHAGFHTSAALFAYLARLVPAQAVLVFGQLLNAGVALAVYRLGVALWGGWRRALLAMLLVGFVFQMPAYYLTWGRYTLLAGLLLLTLAMAAALDVVRRPAAWEPRLRLALLTGGLLLAHYYAALVFALFLLTFTLERSISTRLAGEPAFLRSPGFLRLAGGALLGLLLATPWLAHMLLNARAMLGVNLVAPGDALDAAYYPGYLEYLWYLLGPDRAHLLHAAALLVLLIAGWRGSVRPLAIFTLALGLLSLPWGIHLDPFRPDHGVILAFLPASLLLAELWARALAAPVRPWVHAVVRACAWLGVVGLLVWGIRDTRDVLNPVTLLADEADAAALAWIEAETPEDAVFLINTAGWQGGAYRGVDGGWWILPLTGRRTALPPALYLNGEEAYVWGVIDLARRTSELTACDAAFRGVVEDAQADYVYLREGKGSLHPAALVGCEGVVRVYRGGGVFIYRLDR